MTFPHLPHAPIVEGLIDIQVKPRSEFSMKDIEAFGKRINSSYPVIKDLREVHAELKMSPGQEGAQTVSARQVGIRCERQNPSFVVLARPEELLVSQLAPYETWEKLEEEARKMWEEYRGICMPEIITRVATRFINKVLLPPENLEFNDYLTAPPQVPKALPRIFDSFLTRIVMPHSETGAQLAVTQVMDSIDPQTGKLPILIDIDVYKHVDFAVESSEVWELLRKMRKLKNQAFFDSLTPKALELFQ